MALARRRFPGRALLLSLIDLPFSISPVVAGLMLVLLFGRQGWLGSWNLRVIFAFPGIVLATAFITLPFVVREVLPVLEEAGSEEEEAAKTLGANSWQIFWRITLPNIRWGLLYGVILTNARAMGSSALSRWSLATSLAAPRPFPYLWKMPTAAMPRARPMRRQWCSPCWRW